MRDKQQVEKRKDAPAEISDVIDDMAKFIVKLFLEQQQKEGRAGRQNPASTTGDSNHSEPVN